ncbi:MAG: ABC transporter substrate-binding protein [SAR324 cluster bacterium]|nr:ABC transporter substrate-binding protein [SAR324 cluster bacterium]
MQKKIIFLVLASLCWFSIAAFASEIRIGYTADALSLDPANHRERTTETIIRNMFDGVLTRSSDMKIVPELAESWQQLDSLTYEFKLRQGVKFHSGDEMTADDIKFSLERVINEGALEGQTSPRKSLLGTLKEVKVIDPYKVHMILSEPWPILPAFLPWHEIVSKKFAEKVGVKGMSTQANGNGPFKLVQWDRGSQIVMERFNDYYGGAADLEPVGAAQVDRLIWKIIPENASRVAALLSGNVDIINDLPVHSISQVNQSSNAKVLTVNGTRSFFSDFNHQKAPFNNLLVRQAINHAVDVNLIIEKILGNRATRLNGILSPNAFGHNPTLPEYSYDPEKAKSLLRQAGYPDGFSMTLDTVGAYKDLAEAVVSFLAPVGINAKVQVWESSVLKAKWLAEDNQRDMWLSSWGNGSLDPVGLLVPKLRTKARGNYGKYSNAKIDELIDAANIEPNREKRAAYYQTAESIINREAALLFLWLPQEVYGVSKRLSGWVPSPDGRINLHDAAIN